jgi:ATP dependent DNA ligase C terminal region
MIKVKHVRTADCAVAGFRWHKSGKDTLGSLLLGLYDARGVLQHVGVTSSFTMAKRKELVRELAPLREHALEGHPWRDWTEADANMMDRKPGAQSRWSAGKDLSWEPLRVERVCEVKYDHLRKQRVIGQIDPSHTTVPVIAAPREVEAQAPFSVVVNTFGSYGCSTPDGQDVSEDGDLVRIVPYDIVPRPGHTEVCPAERKVHEHRVSVVFRNRGRPGSGSWAPARPRGRTDWIRSRWMWPYSDLAHRVRRDMGAGSG